jgi:ribosomal protein L16
MAKIKIIPTKRKYALSFRLKTSKTKAWNQFQGQIKAEASVWQSQYHPFTLCNNTRNHPRAWLPTHTPSTNYTTAKQSQKGLDYAVHKHALFGRHAILFDVYGTLTAQCLEKTWKIVSKVAKTGCFWLRLCCQIPISSRPGQIRMGKGKGAISRWETRTRPGQTWYEFAGLSHKKLTEIFLCLRKRSPVKIRLVGMAPNCHNQKIK